MFTLIKNATVYAPENIGKKNVLIFAQKIVSVTDSCPELPKELAVETIDANGNYLIPGLIDSHVHVTGAGGESGMASKVPPLFLSEFTRYGVTTVVGMLGTDDVSRSTSELIVKTKALNQEGITAFCYTGGYHLPIVSFTGCSKSDMVHVNEVIGIGEVAISDHRSSQITFDEFLRLASQAHVASIMTGKAGVLHLHLGDGKKGLELIRRALDESEIPARVFHATHVNRNKKLFEEACELTKKGCHIDLTTIPKAFTDKSLDVPTALKKYLDAGLDKDKITVSSDAGGSMPVFDDKGEVLRIGVGTSEMLLTSIQELVQAGRSLDEVLPAFTSNVSDFLRFKTKGRVQEGLDADLILLNKSLKIQNVMAMGKWHVKDGDVKVFGEYEKNSFTKYHT